MAAKIILPPPLTELPRKQSFFRDFVLLLKNQMRVTFNSIRYQRKGSIVGIIVLAAVFLSLMGLLSTVAYQTLKTISLQSAQVFLAFIFMTGLAGQIFFGITAAFAALYMSEDLELLFMTPVPLKVVFAVKSVSVLGSTLLIALLFAFLPGIFCGLLYHAGVFFYVLVFLIGCGLWLMGAALAELINLLVMRIVPPHRSKEAIGLIGVVAGLIIALIFQVPNLLLSSQGTMDISNLLTGKEQSLAIMNYFPWGWASLALIKGVSGDLLAGFAWSVLIFICSILMFLFSMALLERGFRQGFIALGQGEGGRRRQKQAPVLETRNTQDKAPAKMAFLYEKEAAPKTSSWPGMWAVAKKDLLSLKRDAREWFGYLLPLIFMAFFIAQFSFFSTKANLTSLLYILMMYTVMMSGNLALQSFGREGESDWLLNSVPLAGWPVIWGKLMAAVLPTLVLMEALLVGTSLAIGVSAGVVFVLAIAAVLLSLGSSAIGLYYSINNCRFNPDKPQMRISPGASLIMYLINFLFILLLGLSLCYLFPPAELTSIALVISPPVLEGKFFSTILYGLYLLSRPLLWLPVLRIGLGIILTGGIWSLIFFGFMAATVRESRKGFRVEIMTNNKRSRKKTTD